MEIALWLRSRSKFLDPLTFSNELAPPPAILPEVNFNVRRPGNAASHCWARQKAPESESSRHISPPVHQTSRTTGKKARYPSALLSQEDGRNMQKAVIGHCASRSRMSVDSFELRLLRPSWKFETSPHSRLNLIALSTLFTANSLVQANPKTSLVYYAFSSPLFSEITGKWTSLSKSPSNVVKHNHSSACLV